MMRPNWHNVVRFARRYIRPRRGMFWFVQSLHVLAVVLVILPPLVVRYLIDVAIPAGDRHLLLMTAGAIVGIFVLFFAIAAFKEYWGHEVAQGITSRLRNDLYGHFQKLSMSFHDRTKAGGLMSRLVDDINVVEEVVHHGPEAVVLAVVMILGVMVLMFIQQWRLALVAMAFVPLMMVFTQRTARRMWRSFREVRERKASLSDVLEENLNGIRVIKAFSGEDREYEAIARQNTSHYRSRMAVIRRMCVLFPGAILIHNIGLAVVILYGGYMVMQGALTLGQLFAFIMLMGYFLHPIMRMVMITEQAGQFFASIERFWEYMDIDPDIQDCPGARELAACHGEVRFEDVHFRYDDEPILRGITLTAKPGQMVALVGPSGAGKTTITRLIPRFYEPFRGRILIDGHDIRDLTQRSLRAHIGMVMQDDFLFSGTVAENVGYGRPGASREEIVEAAVMANAAPFVEQMPAGYDTAIGKRGVKLSEGQRQRVSIARALLRDPQILLLDEATSSVDPETERLIQQAMEHLRRGRTTFAIAHRLSTIFHADQIFFVDRGRIIEHGTHAELLARDGKYARFFRIQFPSRPAVSPGTPGSPVTNDPAVR